MLERRQPPTALNQLSLILMIGAALAISAAITVLDFSMQAGVPLPFPPWLPALGTILLAAAVLPGWRTMPAPAWLRGSMALCLVASLGQAVLIGLRFSYNIAPWSAAAYMTSALLVQAVVLASIQTARRPGMAGSLGLCYDTLFSRLVLLVMGFVLFSLASGAFVSLSSAEACSSWPLCGGVFSQVPGEWVHMLHRLAVGLGGLLAIWMFHLGWRTQRSRPRVLTLVTAVAILFAAQGLIGALIASGRSGQVFAGLHAVTGAAVWVLSVILVLEVGQIRPLPAPEPARIPESDRWQRLRDFSALTKPVIVLLLLATTLGGMIAGARAWPAWQTVVWTLLGGALAAGGSGAINQYIDRHVDARMKRTSRRPLVAGRLAPAEALAFGVGLCLLAFYILALFVNLLAALLSFAGMVYYVWLYSLVLKKTTVQNIVIGGGAGAIPPLVGWAAATGEISLAAGLLFVIVFFWTPPHFWALALIRAKDYARGGIPMLPVVRGERETRRQILAYTLVLVALTLLAWPVGLAGWIYTAGALLLGLWLIGIAYRLWREYTPKLAWKMYRQSSRYLLYLFVLLAVDALVG